MMPKKKVYRFNAVLERFEKKGGYHYFNFPYSVEKEFGTKGRLRVDAVVNGATMDRALIPHGDGTHYIILGTDQRRKAKVKEGDRSAVSLSRKDDQDAVNVPEELAAALDLEPIAKERFWALNPGARRNVCYWVNSAKRIETRTERAVEMLRRLESGHFQIGGKKS